jgi:hypothetical protein
MYRSTRVYDYNTTIDWFIFKRLPPSPIKIRGESSVDADGSREEVQGASWMNGQKREGYLLPNTLVQHPTMFVCPLMSLLPPTPSGVVL